MKRNSTLRKTACFTDTSDQFTVVYVWVTNFHVVANAAEMSTLIVDFSGSTSSFWRVLFVAVLILCLAGSGLTCPENCLCYRTHVGPTVRCNHHSLSRIPNVPTSTVVLDLRFNNISVISNGDLAELRHLTTLFLSGNNIQIIEPEAFVGLASLKYLYLFNNKLKRIHENAFSGLRSLEQLYLHLNEIEDIPAFTFNDLTALERLYLHHNRLKSVPRGLFKNLESLRRL